MSQYTTGTVDVTNGSQVVTGIGTLWLGEITAGDLFIVTESGVIYFVGSVDSDTQITLSANYAGLTDESVSYVIARDFTPNKNLPFPTPGDIETSTILKRSLSLIDEFDLLHDFTEISGQIADAQVPESAVTQHESALAIAIGQITGFTDNSTDWDTAFGWGDHAAESYLTANQTITLSGDASGSGTTSIAVTVANDSHTHTGSTISGLDTGDTTTGTFADARIAQSNVTQHQAAIDHGSLSGLGDNDHPQYALLTGAAFTGTVTSPLLSSSSTTSTRDKLRVYPSSNYTIGMQSGITFGGLGDWAMTFQFDDDIDRGFWWGDTAHTTAQGAMSLTTDGKLAVAHSMRLGYGEADTTTPGATYRLDVSGAGAFTGDLFVGGDTTGHLRSVTGQYGSIEVTGNEGSSGGWNGYSIEGRFVLMSNGGDNVGLYNDVDNEWMIQCSRNAWTSLYYNGSNKLQTTNTGANVSGDIAATSHGGITEANLLDKTATETVSGTWSFSGADTPPASLQSSLSANMLHIDGKEAIDGNDVWLRLNQNNDFTSGIYTPNGLRVDGGLRSGNITTGSGNIAATGRIYPITTNTPNSPAYAFSGDTDTGMYQQSGNVLAFSTGGAVRARMLVQSTGRSSTLQFYDHANALRDGGFNDLRNFNLNVSDTLEANHCGTVQIKNTTTGRTLTLEASGSLDFTVGSTTQVWNVGTSGNYTITEGSSTTLYYVEAGTGLVDTAGGCTIGPGGVASIYRLSSTVYYIFGSEITP